MPTDGDGAGRGVSAGVWPRLPCHLPVSQGVSASCQSKSSQLLADTAV